MKKKIETILSSIGIKKKDSHGSVVDPLYLSTNYKFKELGDHPEFDYNKMIKNIISFFQHVP